MKKRFICAAAALICIAALAACSKEDPPSSPADSTAKTPTSPAELLLESMPAATEPPQDIQGLPDELFLVSGRNQEDVVICGNQVVARGNVKLVMDYATGKAVGYTLLTVDPTPGESSDPYMEDNYTSQYSLYRKDGSFWQDCGSFEVFGVLGDWFYGAETEAYQTGLRKLPANKDGQIRAWLEYIAPGHCLLWNVEDEFLGITGIALVDEQLNVIAQLEEQQDAYYLSDNGERPGFLVLEEGGLVDVQTLNRLPYTDVAFINDGYRVFRRPDGLFDVMDAAGSIVESGHAHEIRLYKESVRIEVEEDPISLTNSSLVYLNGQLAYSGAGVDAGYWNGGVFVELTDEKRIRLYDFEGQPLAEYSSDDENTYIYAYDEGGMLNIWDGENNQYWFCDTPFDSGYPAEDFMIFPLWHEKADVTRYMLSHSPTARGGRFVYDLLDEQGNLLKTGFSYLSSSDDPNMYTAQKGFSYGLIDPDGNWLWKESIFTVGDDEIFLY